jgi:hypothetical protein
MEFYHTGRIFYYLPKIIVCALGHTDNETGEQATMYHIEVAFLAYRLIVLHKWGKVK